MDMLKLNPLIRSALLYEKINRTEVCIGYDSRVIYMISGDIAVSVAGAKITHLSPGHFLYIPAGTPYKLKGNYLKAVVVTFDLTSENTENSNLKIIPPSTPESYDESKVHSTHNMTPFNEVIHIEDMSFERDDFLRMSNIFISKEGNYLAQISAMLKLILLKVAQTADSNALPAIMVENLDSYIRENVGDEISNTEIGAVFGYHPFYISKVLKDKKGQTLRQYIISYRLKLAKSKLKLTNKTVNEIAEECGFSDASYFTKTFRNAFDITPKEYRNKFKKDFI